MSPGKEDTTRFTNQITDMGSPIPISSPFLFEVVIPQAHCLSQWQAVPCFVYLLGYLLDCYYHLEVCPLMLSLQFRFPCGQGLSKDSPEFLTKSKQLPKPVVPNFFLYCGLVGAGWGAPSWLFPSPGLPDLEALTPEAPL